MDTCDPGLEAFKRSKGPENTNKGVYSNLVFSLSIIMWTIGD